MNSTLGFRRLARHLVVVLATAMGAAAVLTATASPLESGSVNVIVRAEASELEAVKAHVEGLGGALLLDLSLINGFSASVDESVVSDIRATPGVTAVAPDRSIQLSTSHAGAPNSGGTLHRIASNVVRADRMWKAGTTGEGIGVAVLDSGVAPVGGLNSPGKVLNGPDLSFDGGHPQLQHLDLFGHGTHMAGIIAGADPAIGDSPSAKDARSHFAGIAPGAHVVNVKVADATGAADVSQVIAGIQWIVEHKDDPGVNIRVLNLSFGTDGSQDYRVDPLAFAVETAWRAGIVVVTAAGNDGASLRNPAYDPFVIAVGAADTNGTYGTGDDTILAFSNCGTSERPVDVLAPGLSVESLRVPGSLTDTLFPEAVTSGGHFRGTGTSQAAAVVSGGAALILADRPELTPDEVKALIVETANPLKKVDPACGDSVLDLGKMATTDVPDDAVQAWDVSDGTGSLEAARGSFHVALDGVEVAGEVDVTGQAWSGGTWSGGTWSGGTWSTSAWSGLTWG